MAEEVILKIIEGNLKGEEFVFDEKGLCLIGRSADCALQIPKEKDMKISRRHCLLILDPPSVRIRDLGSRNGTYVNSEALKPGVVSSEPEKESPVDRVLKDKDVVEIGECVFYVEILSAPTAEPKIPILPQIKPMVSRQSSKVVQATPERDPLSPTLSPNAVRPATVTHLSPPKPTSTGNGIAVTEVMSREEIKGASNAMSNIAYTDSANTVSNEQRHNMQEPVRHTPQSPLTAHPSAVTTNNQPDINDHSPGQAQMMPHKLSPRPVVVKTGNTSQPAAVPVPTIKQPGIVQAQSPAPVPVIKQPGRVTNSFSPINQMTDPGPLTPPPPESKETTQVPKKPTIVLTKKKAPGESAITLTPNKTPVQGKTVLKAKIVSKPSSSRQGQNVISLTPKTTGISPSPVAQEPETSHNDTVAVDKNLEKTPTDRMEASEVVDKNLEKTPTDRMGASEVVDKYQDTIVMDPVEMDSIPDLVSSTMPEVSNTKRVAQFKIKGLK